MQSPFSLRRLVPEDGAAYATLLAASPDTGRVGVAGRFEIDPYQALMAVHSDTAGVVAEAPDHPGLVGGGLVRFGAGQWDGQVLPTALLNTLVVHPDFRRQGLASQLAAWRREMARERFGEDGLFWALIQGNNTGSERTARRWATQFLERRMTIIPMKVRSAPPVKRAGLTVRPMEPGEADAVAESLNRYYREYQMYAPESGASLTHWLGESPFETPFRHYLVAADSAGNLLAGLALAELCRLRTSVITRMPGALRLLNRFLQVVPPGGVLKELGVSRVWHAPGQLEAARHLFETVRWEWRNRGTTLMLFADSRSPLMEVFRPRPWTMKTVAGIALRGPTACSEEKPFYYA